jgi:hypothetical protein
MTYARHVRFFNLLAPLIAAMLTLEVGSLASAQELFKTAEAAADALASAAKTGNQEAILKVLGPQASDIVSSGDPVADAETLQRFIAAYDTKHQLTMEGGNKAIMTIGQEDFPLPIPIVHGGGSWRFDTAAGRQEILYRRIGRNELDAIQSALAYVDAQNEYADKDRTGAGKNIYAQRIVSSAGKRDGLYWPDTEGNDASPLGELFAKATAEGYRVGSERIPYHGYYYKILTRQGPAAPGGALDYVVNGNMIGGFALVIYPAEYRNSGVMTFIVNHTGQVYQKDLGPRTLDLAARMIEYNPDKTWSKVGPTEPPK